MPTENRITEQPNEVKRYRFKGAAGEYVYAADFDAATRCFLDAVERCLAAERREQALQLHLNAADERVDHLEAGIKWESDRNALLLASLTEAEDMLSVTSLEAGQRLAAAERRNAELSGHLTQAHKFVEATYGAADSGTLQAGQDASTLWNIDESKAALTKPTDSAAYQSREIGESDWADCSKAEYDRCGKDPHMDTRIKPTESGASE